MRRQRGCPGRIRRAAAGCGADGYPHAALDGLAATRKIRGFDPEARVVIVTDCDDEDLRAAAREAGACGYALNPEHDRVAGSHSLGDRRLTRGITPTAHSHFQRVGD